MWEAGNRLPLNRQNNMGMFDYIRVSQKVTLPELPKEVIDRWGGEEKIAFQTKSLSNSLSSYLIDENGFLKIKNCEYVWVKGDESAESVMDRIGHCKTVSSSWENCDDFTGYVEFYESYSHPEIIGEISINDGRYVTGWIEYGAFFKNGKLEGPIQLVENDPPYKRTDEEYEQYKKDAEISRMETEKIFIEGRNKHPTADQKLIDKIYQTTKIESAIVTHEDYSKALSQIKKLIEKYRTEHDIWYRE